MRIIKPHEQDGPAGKKGSQFTGQVYSYLTMRETDGNVINTVTFEPGARTHWHSHENGQILEVLAGRGFVMCEGDRTPRVINAGDTIWTPPGEVHWHGASQDSYMTHRAISLGVTNWLEPVDEDLYNGKGE